MQPFPNQYEAEVTLSGETPTSNHDAAYAMHAIWPDFPFAFTDITLRLNAISIPTFLIPVPPAVAALLIDGKDYGMTEEVSDWEGSYGTVSIFIAATPPQEV